MMGLHEVRPDDPAALAFLLDQGAPPPGLQVVHQPIVDLARGVVAGYEALARFPGPVTSPPAWFELARRIGRHAELEAAALAAALRSRSGLPPNTFLTVNLGPDVLATEQVQQVFGAERTLDGVVLELTENVRVESFAVLEPALDELRARGLLVAIDDAGAGYAGLHHLLAVRPDFIKLDRALVAGIDRDEAKRGLVQMMGTFASRLDAWLLAEGVETPAELDVLADLGVPLAQGYHLGRPAPGFDPLPPEVAAALRSRAAEPEGDTLRVLVEHVAIAVSDRAARAAFVDDRVDLVVLIDEHERPVATVDDAGLTHAMRDAGLRMALDTPVRQAALRALVRPRGSRFHPIVCVDDLGRHAGIVRVERLIERLARG